MSVLSQTTMSTGGICSCSGSACLDVVEPLEPLAGDLLQGRLGLAVGDLGLRLAAAGSFSLGLQTVRRCCCQSRKYLRVGPAGLVLLAGGVHHRQPRDLDDAALDGVHQAEVADEPGEGLALGVAAALDVERAWPTGRRRTRCRGCRRRGAVDPVQALDQTVASRSSSSSSFFSSPVSFSVSGAGRQQWWPSSLSTMSDSLRGALAFRFLRVGRAVAFSARAGVLVSQSRRQAAFVKHSGSTEVVMVTPGGDLAPRVTTWDSALAAARTRQQVWCHVSNPTREQLSELAELLKLPSHDLRYLRDPDARSRSRRTGDITTVSLSLPRVGGARVDTVGAGGCYW